MDCNPRNTANAHKDVPFDLNTFRYEKFKDTGEISETKETSGESEWTQCTSSCSARRNSAFKARITQRITATINAKNTITITAAE
jgi:hypothetical protein